MKNVIANQIIEHVNKRLATHNSFKPIDIALCEDTGIAKNEIWNAFSFQMQKEVIQIVVAHFRNIGYTVQSLSHNDKFRFSRVPVAEVFPVVEARVNQVNADVQKTLKDIPATITIATNAANAQIKKASLCGHDSTQVDLQEGITYPDTLKFHDFVEIWKFVFDNLREAGYYVHMTSRYHKALVIWDENREDQYKREHPTVSMEAPAPMPEPKKRKLFGKKEK